MDDDSVGVSKCLGGIEIGKNASVHADERGRAQPAAGVKARLRQRSGMGARCMRKILRAPADTFFLQR